MSSTGEVYETATGRLEVLVTGAESDGALHEMRATYPPESPFPPAHLHPEQDERFEVIEGTLTFVVDGEERVVAAGESIDVPRGSAHQVRNAGEVPATAIWQTRPALRTAEFHHEVQRHMVAEDWAQLTATLRGYRDVFVLVPDPSRRTARPDLPAFGPCVIGCSSGWSGPGMPHEEAPVLTVITETAVHEGRESDWDAAYHERAADARKQDGWVDLHLLVPVDDPGRRVVVGTWRDRDAWERWHTTETFKRTRDRLDAATAEQGEGRWFEVVEEKTSS